MVRTLSREWLKESGGILGPPLAVEPGEDKYDIALNVQN
jgi:hypothetical protein